jgi:hypothetical protein
MVGVWQNESVKDNNGFLTEAKIRHAGVAIPSTPDVWKQISKIQRIT